MTNGVSTHDNADISIGEKVSSLVAGDFKLVPWHLPFHFTGWRAEPFIIEAIRFLPEYCNTRCEKQKTSNYSICLVSATNLYCF